MLLGLALGLFGIILFLGLRITLILGVILAVIFAVLGVYYLFTKDKEDSPDTDIFTENKEDSPDTDHQ
ncbi:MAG: hypothetical protein ACR2PY_08645 [Salinispira sp.]